MIRPHRPGPLAAAVAAVCALSPLPSPLHAANFFWKQSITDGNWNNPNNWSALATNSNDNAGVPNAAALVYITPFDGQTRTIHYDYPGPAITLNLLQIGHANNLSTTSTLNIPANTLAAHTVYIGYSNPGGNNATGALALSGGTLAITPSGNGFYLGLNPTDRGSLTLSNTGTLLASNVQVVGYQGTGTFTQTGGSNTFIPGFNYLTIGHLAGSNGLYTLAGGNLAILGNSAYVGNSGNGTMNHSAGAFLINNPGPVANFLFLGSGAGSNGVYNLSGSASLSTQAGHQYVGHSGNGTFNQSGGTNSAGNLYIGTNMGSAGAYNLSGGSLTVSQVLLGNAPGVFGRLTVTGGRLLTTNLYLGAHENGTGTVSIANAAVTVTNLLQFGLTAPLSISSGTLTVGSIQYTVQAPYFAWSGGTINVTSGTFRLPYAQTTHLTSPFGGNFTGGAADPQNNAWRVDSLITLSAQGAITVGSSATPRHLSISSGGNNALLHLNHPDASVLVHGNAYVSGTSAGANNISGTLSLTAGALTVNGNLQFFQPGRVLLAGGSLTVSAFIGTQFVPLEWSGGTFTVTSQTFEERFLYSETSSSIVHLANNHVGNFFGGSSANSAFNINGRPVRDEVAQSGPSTINIGTPAVPRHLSIGSGGSTFHFATYSLSHPLAALTVHGNAYVGGSPLVGGPVGNFTLINGNATIANTLKLWNAGTLNLSGGTLSVGHIDASANPAGINWTAGTLRLRGGAILGPTLLTVPAPGTLAGSGSFLGGLLLNGNIALHAYDQLAIHGNIAGPGTVTLAPIAALTTHALRAHTLILAGNLRLLPASAGASKLDTLTIAGAPNNWTGQLDLTSNALILQTSSPADKAAKLPTLKNQILAGKASGNWQGKGLTSSTVALDPADLTLALADNATLGYTSFRGQPVDANSLLITSALFGDANLDQTVDAFDLNLLAAHWQQASGALWSDGDFSGDGTVDAFDLNLLAGHWQSTASLLSALLQSAPLAAIPEPASLCLAAAPLAILLGKRRRRATPHTCAMPHP